MTNAAPLRERVPIKKLKRARYNPRKISKKELQKLVESIKTYGLVQPIVVNKDYTIIGGHQRVEACRQLGMTDLDVYVLDLKPDDEKVLNLALNRISGDWDDAALYDLLNGLAEKNRMALTGFDNRELEKLKWKQGNQINRKLIEDYIVPPFSIFDTKQGYWQKRKAEWNLQLGDGGEGRAQDLMELDSIAKVQTKTLTGTSVFDPVLCEILYTWYLDKGALIVDPFAGGHTRGLVASRLGHRYIGTDVSKLQVQANDKRAKEIGERGAHWEVADGADLAKVIKGITTVKGEKAILGADMLFTCPPYYNLEQYDPENPLDLSNKPSYEAFIAAYSKVLINTYNIIKPNGWAIIVIGNVRDDEGNYYDLVGDTVRIMREAGYHFYNEAILATAIATATVRARRTFDSGKKLVKTHQNILFFAKGKEVAINKALRELLLNGRTATAHHDVLIFKK